MHTEIIIAGFHRSGTSMVTQLLHAAGLFVGDDLLGAMPSNPYGHFEDTEVVAIHERILADNSVNWQVGHPLILRVSPNRWSEAARFVSARRLAHGTWAFKDPRVCLFLPVWKHLLPAAKLLVVFRSAVDAAYSLERRHSSQYLAGEGSEHNHLRFWREPDLALRMWLEHNRGLLRFADHYPDDAIAVSFDTVSSGFPLVDLLNERWHLALDPIPSHRLFDPSATSSRTYPMTVSDPNLIDAAMESWQRLIELERRTALAWEPRRAA
ncbi:MAG: hypothetical protein H0V96_03390 [Acidimicrobiia bacterium]|nr:hypothetical protein [Acidimicrobiia bacterium]